MQCFPELSCDKGVCCCCHLSSTAFGRETHVFRPLPPFKAKSHDVQHPFGCAYGGSGGVFGRARGAPERAACRTKRAKRATFGMRTFLDRFDQSMMSWIVRRYRTFDLLCGRSSRWAPPGSVVHHPSGGPWIGEDLKGFRKVSKARVTCGTGVVFSPPH